METFRTEEEQVEAIKRWWQENGKSTVLGVVLAMAAVFGWRGWNDYQREQAAEASVIYDNLLQADAALANDASKRSTAEHLAETLKSAYSSLNYAQYAALIKAKYAVADGDYSTAENELNWVLEQKPEEAIRLQAQLRLAKVKAASGDKDAALTMVAKLEATSVAPLAAELRGDILLDQGKPAEALAAYEQARVLGRRQESPMNNPLLEMKINSLAAHKVAADQ